MKKNFLLFATFSLLSVYPSNAEVITESQALNIASSFSSKEIKTKSLKSAGTSPKLKLAYTRAEKGKNLLYVFNRGTEDGYVIVSGDDNATKVLGYSDCGTFDAANMPESLKWWLSEYSREIEYASTHHVAHAESAVKPFTTSVAPLLGETQWDQSSPYNKLCPKIGMDICPTGCVATAMAQILYYHKWPEKGEGTYSYNWNGTTLSFDYGNTTFEWDKMQPKYTGEYSQEAGDAVATLMYACGVSVDMVYTPNFSGAEGEVISRALCKYFKYDKGMYFFNRSCCSKKEWESLLKNELDNKRPILYGGIGKIKGDTIGHAFVCDGYNFDGYFHYNWGWSGMSDGYFKTTALNPSILGTGGGNGGFNSDQQIVIGFQPETGNNDYVHTLCVFGNGKISAINKTISKGADNTFNCSCKVMAMGVFDEIYNIGIAVYDSQNNIVDVETAKDSFSVPLSQHIFLGNLNVKFRNDIDKGFYTVKLVSKTENSDWEPIRTNIETPYINLEVTDNEYIFTSVETSTVNFSDIVVKGDYLAKGIPYNITATANCTSSTPYYRDVYVALLKGTSIKWKSQMEILDINGCESLSMTFKDKVADELEAGEYTLAVIDGDNNVLGSVPVVLNETTSGGIISATKSSEILTANKDNITIRAFITNSGTGFYFNNLEMQIWTKDDPANPKKLYMRAEDSQYVKLEAGETKEIDFQCSYEGGATDLLCYAFLVEGDKDISSYIDMVSFKLKEEAGVEQVSTDASITIAPNPVSETLTVNTQSAISNIEVYSMQGARLMNAEAGENVETINVSDLAAGTYIIRIMTADGIENKQFIKR